MPNYPTNLVAVPQLPGVSCTPFTESQTATAAAVNTITLPAVAGRRYAILRIVASSAAIAVVSGLLTVTNIAKRDGTAGTVSYQFVEGTTTGGLMILNFDAFPLFAFAENTAVVVSIAAIGSGAATALEVTGVMI